MIKARIPIPGTDVPVEVEVQTPAQLVELIGLLTARGLPVQPLPPVPTEEFSEDGAEPWSNESADEFISQLSLAAQRFVFTVALRWPTGGVTIDDSVREGLVSKSSGIGPLVAGVNRRAQEMRRRRPILDRVENGVARYFLTPEFLGTVRALLESHSNASKGGNG